MEFADKSEVSCAASSNQSSDKCEYLKRLRGQFFTTTNPFVNEAFVRWFKGIRTHLGIASFEIVEPFAGSNNIVWMVRELGFDNPWTSYDIDPPDENTAEDVPVLQRDVLKMFPPGFRVAITNPPYLAKNIATSRGMPFEGGGYDDLYQQCVATMLEHCDYVAAIIPETFIKQELFHDRLSAVVSLTCRMFDDTEHPVCLALFSPAGISAASMDFEVWQGNRLIGSYQQLKSHILPAQSTWSMTFNDREGRIGLRAFDGTETESIEFVAGDDIPADKVKPSSRHNTRISIEGLSERDVKRVIKEANKLLSARRKATNDVFMTAHRGLRADGKYRRRLDYEQARELLNHACARLNLKGGRATPKKP